MTDLPRGAPEPRPSKRRSANLSLVIGGHEIGLSFSKRADGTIREFFLDLHKEGAPLKGTAHVLSVMASNALQAGMRIEDVCKSLRSKYFEPAGEVTGHETITHARSLFDLVAQVLEHEDSSLRAKGADHGRR